MSIKTIIEDGKGSENTAFVDEEGAFSVVIKNHPPREEQSIAFPFRQYLSDDGTSTGNFDMRVNGSVTNIDFFIEAVEDEDTYIKTISTVIVDAGATLSEFGNLSALTNGIEVTWQTQDKGTVIIAESLQTNFDFVRLAVGEPSFGDGATAFTANNISGQSEGFLPVIDFQKIFGLQYGIKLRKGTKDRLFFRIKDNITAIDEFNAIVYGVKF